MTYAYYGLCVACYGFVWPGMAMYVLVWLCMALYGDVWPYLALRGPIVLLWSFMACIWPYMVFYGTILSFLAVIDRNSFGHVLKRTRLKALSPTS